MQPALDAVLQPHEVHTGCRRPVKVMKRMVVEGDLGFERDLGGMAVRRLIALNWWFARADDRMGVRKAAKKPVMSTTKSVRIGKFASGSTVISAPWSWTEHTHASSSRPSTCMPQVPHEACRHEWRSVSDGSRCSWIQRKASSTVVWGPTGTSNSSKCSRPSPRWWRSTRNDAYRSPSGSSLSPHAATDS